MMGSNRVAGGPTAFSQVFDNKTFLRLRTWSISIHSGFYPAALKKLQQSSWVNGLIACFIASHKSGIVLAVASGRRGPG